MVVANQHSISQSEVKQLIVGNILYSKQDMTKSHLILPCSFSGGNTNRENPLWAKNPNLCWRSLQLDSHKPLALSINPAVGAHRSDSFLEGYRRQKSEHLITMNWRWRLIKRLIIPNLQQGERGKKSSCRKKNIVNCPHSPIWLLFHSFRYQIIGVWRITTSIRSEVLVSLT